MCPHQPVSAEGGELFISPDCGRGEEPSQPAGIVGCGWEDWRAREGRRRVSVHREPEIAAGKIVIVQDIGGRLKMARPVLQDAPFSRKSV